MINESSADAGEASRAVRELGLEDAFQLHSAYEEAAGKVKSRTWAITTWVLTLEAALIAFSVEFYTEQSADGGFLLIQLAIAIVGVALCLFLLFLIRDQGNHLKEYWAAQRKLVKWNTELRRLALADPEEDLSEPVKFPPFCTRLISLVVLFAIGFVVLFAMMRHLADRPDADLYQRAISDAAVIEPDEIVTLEPLEGEEFTVVTWTRFPESYGVGDEVTLTWGEVWVTVAGDVRQECVRFDGTSLRQDLQQLLGLPIDQEPREFVTLVVSKDDLFRPCADPDENKNHCTAEFPEDVDPLHKAWYARHAATSYLSPSGLPWTRLGYTYNWRPGASEIGIPEYVIRQSAKVEVVARAATAEYCSVSSAQ